MYLRRIDVTKLVRLRADKLWSQNVLAARAGVGARTIGRIETGRHDVNPVTAVKIARALDVDPDAFSAEVDDRSIEMATVRATRRRAS
jgi:transcriptional regulator with XRE-family HTH domain